MTNHRIHKDKAYTLFELSDRTGMRVAELQELVHRGKLASHYTDDTEVINGKDFLELAESIEQDQSDFHHFE
ncbi:hypothetical protein JJB07_05205 [Tumebacillus sp. ITR2]|uniref:Helix-turn-helix domain-containing protein n=1 Tax=Tumebacillus amylolyticus TaxID=2801339 RepID=A0ABS1J774_9BACL|nr:hypothetical protein [Tumebacillus amylolyticus]MBL0386045.1 hypothetical protein [Tumebacillus amylolyticus]